MDAKRKRDLRRRVGLSVVAPIVILVVVELIFRCVLWAGSASLSATIGEYRSSWYHDSAPQIQYKPHPYMGYVRWDQGAHDEINRHGFYGLDYPFKKARRTFRVVTLGGSTTAGPMSWPLQLETELRSRGLSENVEVINLGMGGWTSAEAVAAMAYLGISYEPDAVVVHLVNNDLTPMSSRDFSPDYTHYRRMMDVDQAADGRAVMRLGMADSLDGWLVGCSSIYVYAKLWLSGPVPRRANLHSLTVWPDLENTEVSDDGRATFHRNLRSIAALAQANDATMVLTTMPVAKQGHPRVKTNAQHLAQLATQNAQLRALGKTEGWIVVDLEGLAADLSPHFTDAIHVTVPGQKIKAEPIADALMKAGLVREAIRAQ